MERAYSIAQARDRLAALVHDAEGGNPVRITRRGRPVAVLVSEQDYDRLSNGRPDFWEAWTSFRARVDEEDLPGVREALEDLRDPAPGRDVAL